MRFMKLAGCGNDFVIVEAGDATGSASLAELARALCDRTTGIGADGLALIEPSRGDEDFQVRIANADGTEAEMSGNGGRCIARYALGAGLAGPSMVFSTLAGPVAANVDGPWVDLTMPEPRDLDLYCRIDLEGRKIELHRVNTGVDHVVLFEDRVEEVDVLGLGRGIRRHPSFEPRGVNVNFVSVRPDRLVVRTYERGVEGETQACGTGCVAAAVVAAALDRGRSPTAVEVRSGDRLVVSFTIQEKRFTKVVLGGPTEFICDGTVAAEFLHRRGLSPHAV